MAVNDEDKKIAYEKLLNTEFAWGRNSLSQADTVSSVSRLMDKDIVRESIIKMKYGKAGGPTGVVSEMVKTPGEAGGDMITDRTYSSKIGKEIF